MIASELREGFPLPFSSALGIPTSCCSSAADPALHPPGSGIDVSVLRRQVVVVDTGPALAVNPKSLGQATGLVVLSRSGPQARLTPCAAITPVHVVDRLSMAARTGCPVSKGPTRVDDVSARHQVLWVYAPTVGTLGTFATDGGVVTDVIEGHSLGDRTDEMTVNCPVGRMHSWGDPGQTVAVLIQRPRPSPAGVRIAAVDFREPCIEGIVQCGGEVTERSTPTVPLVARTAQPTTLVLAVTVTGVAGNRRPGHGGQSSPRKVRHHTWARSSFR